MSKIEPGLHYPLDLEELPKNWAAVYVGDAATEIRSGFASGKHNQDGTGIPHLRPMNVSRGGEIDLDVIKYVDPDKDTRRLSKGDVLFNNTNSAELIGKTALVKQDEDWAFSNHMTRVRFSEAVDPSFAAHQLHFLWMRGYFLHRCVKHVNQASISGKTLSSAIPLVIAPLPEQRRIVARIEELFSRLDAGVAALRQAKAQLQRYRQSVLAAAVTGELTKEWREQHNTTMDNWRHTTLGDESNLVTSGSRGWAKYYAEDGPLFIRAQNIKTDALVLDDLAHVQPPETSEGKRTQVFEHDLLITITGANVTKSALVTAPLREAYVSQHVALVRPSDPAISAFLYYAIISPRNGRAFLEEKAYGAGKPGLNLTNIRELPIALPPLAEQHRIVAEVEARTTAIDHLEAELDRQITRSNRLRQSTLSAAFSGRLNDISTTLSNK